MVKKKNWRTYDDVIPSATLSWFYKASTMCGIGVFGMRELGDMQVVGVFLVAGKQLIASTCTHMIPVLHTRYIPENLPRRCL